MDIAVTSTPALTATNLNSAPTGAGQSASKISGVSARDEIAFDLGLWLSGIESFIKIRTHAFAETNQSKSVARDWSREFHLTHSALQSCANSALRLSELLKASEAEIEIHIGNAGAAKNQFKFSFDEIFAFAGNLKDLVILNETLLRAAPHKFGEWNGWSEILRKHLNQSGVCAKIIENAELESETHLPAALFNLLENSAKMPGVKADLKIVLPHFAKILRWLGVVRKMLEDDQPLKPALLIFARIYEQMQTMMNYLRHRLLRFANEEEELYGVLDCALYAASIELRKVFNFELAGLSEMRQPLSIRAKIETSHALLNDCVQLILVQFAQFIEPDFEPTRLFPNFQTKLDQSLALRRDLWNIQQNVKQAEQHPDNILLEQLNDKLNKFLRTSLRFLMYKDCETFERFTEEVMRTRNKKDLVPILHRFGAYLETLFGQVNMRTVLSTFPFDYPKNSE